MIDVVIIGGNHNGLTMANMLANLGLQVKVIEKFQFRPQRPKGSASRLLAIAKESVAILEKFIGALDNIGGPINRILVTDEASPHELEFDPSDINESNFGYMVDEYDLTARLIDVAKSHKNVELTQNCAVEGLEQLDDGVRISLANSQVINAKLVIACDGKRSEARARLGIEYFEYDYKQAAIVFDIKHQTNHRGLAVEKFMPSGPFAILPQLDGYKSSVVWTVEKSLRNTLMSLSENDFYDLIKSRMPDFYGDFEIASDRGAFDLTKIVAKEYYEGGVVLLGDSLHSIHPLAGQGYNLSLRDAEKLFDLIQDRLDLGLPINSTTMLEEYSASRSNDNAFMAEATNFVNVIFSNDNAILKAGRGAGIALINNIPALKRIFMKYACGL